MKKRIAFTVAAAAISTLVATHNKEYTINTGSHDGPDACRTHGITVINPVIGPTFVWEHKEVNGDCARAQLAKALILPLRPNP